jgi:hypothetical protein
MEDVMQIAITRRTIARRVVRMALTWLALGAFIGASGAAGQADPIEIFSMMMGGMAVFPIVGIVLGLIGGDARGSVVGVAGGLLGGRLAEVMSTTAIPTPVLSVTTVAGGLFGATGLLFLRFWLWRVRTTFRIVRWLVAMTPMSATASARSIHLASHRLARVSVHESAR